MKSGIFNFILMIETVKSALYPIFLVFFIPKTLQRLTFLVIFAYNLKNLGYQKPL